MNAPFAAVPQRARFDAPNTADPTRASPYGSSHCAAEHPGPAGDARATRLWLFSDLRVDLNAFAMPRSLPDFDAVLVAGNIAPGLARSVRWLAEALDGRQGDRPVIFVPGPVEFTDRVPVGDALVEAAEIARELGIALLHDEAIRIGCPAGDGIFVLGATLWPSFGAMGLDKAHLARGHARTRWPQCRTTCALPNAPFLPHDAAGAHARSRAFVEDGLAAIWAADFGGGRGPVPIVRGIRGGDRAVVLTALPPSQACLPPTWAHPLVDPWSTAWLASDLDMIFERPGAPAAWLHGGVPDAIDFRRGRTRIVANPGGARDPTNGFDPVRIVSV